MSYYITASSSGSLDRFPNNRGGDFKTVLAETLFLNSAWEMGLSEIIYKKDWPNIRENENVIVIEALNDCDIYAAINKIKTRLKKLNGKLCIQIEKPTRKAYYFNEIIDERKGLDVLLEQIAAFISNSLTIHFNLSKRPAVLCKVDRVKKEITLALSEGMSFSAEFVELLSMGDMREVKANTSYSWQARELIDVWDVASKTLVIKRHTVTIPQRYYADTDALLATIDQAMGNVINATIFSITKKADNSACIEFNPPANMRRWWRISMSKALYEILGFDRGQLNVGKDESELYISKANIPMDPLNDSTIPLTEAEGEFVICAKREIGLNRSIDTLWIYTDIVKNQITGNRLVPLLRIVPSRGKRGETVVVDYPQPHYLPINVYTINTINIKIFNTYGVSPIPFQSDVIVKLHFRRQRPE